MTLSLYTVLYYDVALTSPNCSVHPYKMEAASNKARGERLISIVECGGTVLRNELLCLRGE